jgi:hypothetical protein
MSFPLSRESRIKKVWIPNQVGDDSGVVFGDDKLLLISDKRFQGIQMLRIPDKRFRG